MSEQAALNGRAAFAATLNENIRELNKYIDGENISTRLLQQKLNKVVTSRDMLISKHYQYAEKANIEIESPELLQWITPKLDESTDIMYNVFLLIEELETQNKKKYVRGCYFL